MIFHHTALADARLIELQRQEDHRGFFARSWCRREFAAQGLDDRLVQCSISFNHERGTLRGMHYQLPPFAETKLIRCTMGAVHDVIVDLRPNSPTYRRWAGFELSADNRRLLYVPQGFAHGYLTLTDEAEIFYQMSEFHAPDQARGIRWNDPALGIEWPFAPVVLSDRDRDFPDFEPASDR